MSGACPTDSILNSYNISECENNVISELIKDLFKFIQDTFDGDKYFMGRQEVTWNPLSKFGEEYIYKLNYLKGD